MNKRQTTRPAHPRAATLIAVVAFGLALAACDRADDTQAGGAVTPAAPAAPASSPASGSGADSGAASQPSGNPGTGPSSDSSSATGGGSSPANSNATGSNAANSQPAGAPQGGEALTSTSAAGGGSGANVPGGGAGQGEGSRDAKETDPQNLTGQEEKDRMPEALQSGHSHSSTALDAPQEENRKQGN